MIVVERTVRVGAPPERVFEYITDVSRIPEWQKAAGVTRVEVEGEASLEKGTDFEMVRVSRGREATIHCNVVRFEPGQRFTFTIKDDDGFTGDTDTILTPDGDGTRLQLTFRMRPPGAWRLLSPVIKREIEKATDADLASLRERLASQPA